MQQFPKAKTMRALFLLFLLLSSTVCARNPIAVRFASISRYEANPSVSRLLEVSSETADYLFEFKQTNCDVLKGAVEKWYNEARQFYSQLAVQASSGPAQPEDIQNWRDLQTEATRELKACPTSANLDGPRLRRKFEEVSQLPVGSNNIGDFLDTVSGTQDFLDGISESVTCPLETLKKLQNMYQSVRSVYTRTAIRAVGHVSQQDIDNWNRLRSQMAVDIENTFSDQQASCTEGEVQKENFRAISYLSSDVNLGDLLSVISNTEQFLHKQYVKENDNDLKSKLREWRDEAHQIYGSIAIRGHALVESPDIAEWQAFRSDVLNEL